MGVFVANVAKYYGMTRRTAAAVVRRVESRRSGTVMRRRGRPRKLTSELIQKLVQTLKANRFLPRDAIAALFKVQVDISVSTRTVPRCLHLLGYGSYSAAEKPYIRPANLIKRSA